MPIYTVHEPDLKRSDAAFDPDRVVFVRDGFYFWAFLLGPVWLIWRGLWLALAGYVALIVALGGIAYLLPVRGLAFVSIAFLIALLLGFEAGTLRRWTLRRNGLREVAAVVGDDLESAERRFFTARTATSVAAPLTPPPSVPPSAMRMPRGAPSDVVGLFPEPGGSR